MQHLICLWTLQEEKEQLKIEFPEATFKDTKAAAAKAPSPAPGGKSSPAPAKAE